MDLRTFKFVVELAESYIRETDMGAEEVIGRLRKVMDGYCQKFAVGDLVKLADGRIGSVCDQTELFYWVRMPGGVTEIVFPPTMTKVSVPTVEDVASDAKLVVEYETDLDECHNCGKALPKDPYISSAGNLFCHGPCRDDFYCQGP